METTETPNAYDTDMYQLLPFLCLWHGCTRGGIKMSCSGVYLIKRLARHPRIICLAWQPSYGVLTGALPGLKGQDYTCESAFI